jgi:hypothetical protein
VCARASTVSWRKKKKMDCRPPLPLPLPLPLPPPLCRARTEELRLVFLHHAVEHAEKLGKARLERRVRCAPHRCSDQCAAARFSYAHARARPLPAAYWAARRIACATQWPA